MTDPQLAMLLVVGLALCVCVPQLLAVWPRHGESRKARINRRLWGL